MSIQAALGGHGASSQCNAAGDHRETFWRMSDVMSWHVPFAYQCNVDDVILGGMR